MKANSDILKASTIIPFMIDSQHEMTDINIRRLRVRETINHIREM